MPQSTPQHDALYGICGASVKESFMIHQLQETTEEFMNSLIIEPQLDWSSGAHDDPGHHSAYTVLPPAIPCSNFKQQQDSWKILIQEPCAGRSPMLPTSQPGTLVRSCRAHRALSGGLGANSLQAAWRCRTVKHSSPLQHVERQHSFIPAVSSASGPQHLDSCIAALWEGEGAGMFEQGLPGADNLSAIAKPSRVGQPYELKLEDFFPAPMSGAAPGEDMQDHIFSDCCFRTDLDEDTAKDVQTPAAHQSLSPALVKPQQPLSTSSDDEFCAMLFENAPSLTSSEASLAFYPSEQDRQQCSGPGKRSHIALNPSRSLVEQSKKICLDLGLERGQDMYHIKKETSTAPLQVNCRPAQPSQQTSAASARKMQAAKDSRRTAGGAVTAAAASSPRGKPAHRAEMLGRGSEACRGAQAKRRPPHVPASKPHRAQQLRDDTEGPRGPGSPTPFAAVQALLEWQALSHRVVSAAASPNQALAWAMLTDNELAHFLAKMGKAATIVSAAGAGADGGSRECLIHGIKQIVGSARTGKATAAQGVARPTDSHHT